MRMIVIGITLAMLAACQPEPKAEPEVAALAEVAAEAEVSTALAASFEHVSDAASAGLIIQEDTGEAAFRLDCTAAALTMSGPTSQVALGNMAMPYSISLSGERFPADLVPGDEAAPTFAVTAPLTPEILTALDEATTARIFVNDGYAFVESGIDSSNAFETLASACAGLSGIALAP